MKKRSFWLILVFCLFVNHGISKDKIRIAIMDFKGKGVSKTVANTVSDMIRTEMINIGKYIVIERSQMNLIMMEQGLQQTGCTDVSCAVKVGKLLSARKMMVGTISKLGKSIVINGRIVDIEKGVGEFGQTERARSMDDLLDAVSQFTMNLSLRIEGKKSEEKKRNDYTSIYNKSIGNIKFVYIKGGEFMMGSPDDEGHDDEHPKHKVYVDDFWISKYEVTQSQYIEIMKINPSRFKGLSRPVEQVSWNDAIDYCKRFSTKYGVEARLPYEAEWEYAVRAGTSTKYYWGNKINNKYCWYATNSSGKTHNIGKKKSNTWNLYDMSGNVWEWCLDRYGEDYYNRSRYKNPAGPTDGDKRVLRGGAWNLFANYVRSSIRSGDYPGNSNYNYGFRVVLSAP